MYLLAQIYWTVNQKQMNNNKKSQFEDKLLKLTKDLQREQLGLRNHLDQKMKPNYLTHVTKYKPMEPVTKSGKKRKRFESRRTKPQLTTD